MSTPPTAVPGLEVLHKNEIFEGSDEGFKYAATIVVYRQGENIYHARVKTRQSLSSGVSPEDLENIMQIPLSAHCPKFASGLTRATEAQSMNSYVKKPSLSSWDAISKGPRPNFIAEEMLEEARIYELLLKNPHPNIATYFGCHVSNDAITGLCLKKYSHTLMAEVNPGNLSKRAAKNKLKTDKDYSVVLSDIEDGVRHFHALGLVHNDINPRNIMIDDGRAVIIDFGSCRKSGESLEDVGRTYEWYDEKVQLSLPENDLAALEEIRVWIGASSKDFQFED